MKRFLKYLPGFRSEMLWMKILSTIIHTGILLIIIIPLTSTTNASFSPTDQFIEKISMALFLLSFIILPYILITNIFSIRKRLPLFKRNTASSIVLGSITSLFLILVLFGTGESILSNYHSPQYKAVQETKKQAQLAMDKANAEKSAQVQAQLAKDKANAEKNAQVQAQLTKDKADAEKNAQVQAQLTKDKADAEKNAQVQAQLTKDKADAEKNAKVRSQIEQTNENPNPDSTQANGAIPNIIPGFVPYESDGFKIQVPNHWIAISSKIQYRISGDKNSLDSIKVPIEEKYSFMYDEYRFFTDILIIPKTTFEKNKANYMYLNNYQTATVKNSELSYVAKDFSNSLVRPSSYKIIALRGDVCYILECHFTGYSEMEIQGGSYDSNKKELQRYLSEIELMVPSFELTSDYADFKSITQNNQNLILMKDL